MKNIDKIKCVLIDFENNDKTLDEAATEILLLFSVSGRSEQLSDSLKDQIKREELDPYSPHAKWIKP
jgi:hypothetical protein